MIAKSKTLRYRLFLSLMARKGALWNFYHRGEKQNTAHYRAYCLGCLNHNRPKGLPLITSKNCDQLATGADTKADFEAGACP